MKKRQEREGEKQVVGKTEEFWGGDNISNTFYTLMKLKS